jgi:hypothetical protein
VVVSASQLIEAHPVHSWRPRLGIDSGRNVTARELRRNQPEIESPQLSQNHGGSSKYLLPNLPIFFSQRVLTDRSTN